MIPILKLISYVNKQFLTLLNLRRNIILIYNFFSGLARILQNNQNNTHSILAAATIPPETIGI